MPFTPEHCTHNAHMFYIKTKDIEERTRLIAYLKKNGVTAVFHYILLHSAPVGQKFDRFYGEDRFTSKESERLIRLPMFWGLAEKDLEMICNIICDFYIK